METKVRAATDQEILGMIEASRIAFGTDEEETYPEQAAAGIIVSGYMTDCPGYCGDVGILLWRGSPGYVNSFTKCDGKWVMEERE